MECGYFSAAMSSLAPPAQSSLFGAIGFQPAPPCPCDPSVFSLSSLHSSFVVCTRYASSSSSSSAADNQDSFDCRAGGGGGIQMRSRRLDSPGTVVAVLRNVERNAEAFRVTEPLASEASPRLNLAKTRSPVERQIVSSHPLTSFVDKAGIQGEFILRSALRKLWVASRDPAVLGRRGLVRLRHGRVAAVGVEQRFFKGGISISDALVSIFLMYNSKASKSRCLF